MMTQFYSDQSRESEPTSLPDSEVFFLDGTDPEWCDPEDPHRLLEAGWYWQTCLPGCLPDSDPIGPFETEEEAIADCRDQN